MDMDRTRAGQYKLTLKRDLLADFIGSLANQPVYVEKGYISDIQSPLLCNNEGLVVNQIKTDEILLKDTTECPWLVMYLKKGALGSTSIGTGGKVTIDIPENDGDVYETLATPIGQWGMYQYTGTDYNVMETLNFKVFWTKTDTVNDYEYICNASESSAKYITGTHYTTNLRAPYNSGSSTFKAMLDQYYKDKYNVLKTKLTNDINLGTHEGIWKYNEKIIKDSNGKYYQVSVYENNYLPIPTGFVDGTTAPTLKAQMQTLWNNMLDISITANDTAFGISGTMYGYRIKLTEVSSIEASVDFSAYTGNGTVDSALYDVICMPYGEVYFTNPSELLYGLTTSKERSVRVMNSLAKALSSNWVLDLQLLPYCPCQELIYESSSPTIIPLTLAKQGLTGYKQGVGVTDVLLVATKATFDLNIYQSISITDNSSEDSVYKIKYVNDCTMVRLCSPNYNGLFDMNLAKNGGSIDYFNVDITMRPYNPYIHVNPNFNFLYNRDFNDARGLICGGDFSLGIINDAWTQYEIQNKNYQAIFDRQIQNMDINNSIARTEAGWQAAAGTVQGAASGAMAGGIAGGG